MTWAVTVPDRFHALEELHNAGIRTYAMVAPVFPGAEGLGGLLKGKIDCVLFDWINYHSAGRVYREHRLWEKLSDEHLFRIRQEFDSL